MPAAPEDHDEGRRAALPGVALSHAVRLVECGAERNHPVVEKRSESDPGQPAQGRRQDEPQPGELVRESGAVHVAVELAGAPAPAPATVYKTCIKVATA